MIERVLEGTWEEIAAHAGELAGRRVRVHVLEPNGNENGGRDVTPPNATLGDLMAPFIGILRSQDDQGESHLSENTEVEFGRILEQKRREGHL